MVSLDILAGVILEDNNYGRQFKHKKKLRTMGGKWWSKDASEWHRRIRDIRNKPNLFRGLNVGMEYAPRDGPLLRRPSPVLVAFVS